MAGFYNDKPLANLSGYPVPVGRTSQKQYDSHVMSTNRILYTVPVLSLEEQLHVYIVHIEQSLGIVFNVLYT